MKDLTHPRQPLFESIKQTDTQQQEYWYARDLMKALEYSEWRNFAKVIAKAKQSLAKSYPHQADHFVELNKMIKVAAGTNKSATRTIKDYKLSRYACYLITQNGDPKKEAIALAQSYFAHQTRRQELINQDKESLKRIVARQKLVETEKNFSGVLRSHKVDGRGIAEIRSAGDKALFNKNTRAMKERLGVDRNKPLADYLPTITLKAKDLATEMTTYQTKVNNLHGKLPIRKEHVHNNQEVRKLLNQNGIYPEELPPEQDIKKLKQKIRLTDEERFKLATSNSTLLTDGEILIDITNVFDEEELFELNEVIDNNPGDVKLKILYGDPQNPKMIVRNITPKFKVVQALQKYALII